MLFQFLIGSLKTHLVFAGVGARDVFQFLIGSLKTRLLVPAVAIYVSLLIGSLKTAIFRTV